MNWDEKKGLPPPKVFDNKVKKLVTAGETAFVSRIRPKHNYTDHQIIIAKKHLI